MALQRIPSNQVYRSVNSLYPPATHNLRSAVSKPSMFSGKLQVCKSQDDSSDTGLDIDTEWDTQSLSDRGFDGDSHSHCLAASID